MKLFIGSGVVSTLLKGNLIAHSIRSSIDFHTSLLKTFNFVDVEVNDRLHLEIPLNSILRYRLNSEGIFLYFVDAFDTYSSAKHQSLMLATELGFNR